MKHLPRASQISAGSRTNPGGYNDNEQFDTSQFSWATTVLDEVVADVTSMGYIRRTGCYRINDRQRLYGSGQARFNQELL